MIEAIQALDIDILFFIQENLRGGFLEAAMKLFTRLGDYGMLWIAIALILMISPKTRRAGVDLILCIGIATLFSNLIIKPIIARPRPFITYAELIPLVEESAYSFPSGHACSSFASATALALAFGRKGAWAYLPAAIIALSRLYVGVHYPSDVIFGAILGVLLAMLTYRLSGDLIKIPALGEQRGKRE